MKQPSKLTKVLDRAAILYLLLHALGFLLSVPWGAFLIVSAIVTVGSVLILGALDSILFGGADHFGTVWAISAIFGCLIAFGALFGQQPKKKRRKKRA